MTDLEKRMLSLENIVKREIISGDEVLKQIMGLLKDFQDNLDSLEKRLTTKK